jgi:hypothetical protein
MARVRAYGPPRFRLKVVPPIEPLMEATPPPRVMIAIVEYSHPVTVGTAIGFGRRRQKLTPRMAHSSAIAARNQACRASSKAIHIRTTPAR